MEQTVLSAPRHLLMFHLVFNSRRVTQRMLSLFDSKKQAEPKQLHEPMFTSTFDHGWSSAKLYFMTQQERSLQQRPLLITRQQQKSQLVLTTLFDSTILTT